jgi:hypothetical protein
MLSFFIVNPFLSERCSIVVESLAFDCDWGGCRFSVIAHAAPKKIGVSFIGPSNGFDFKPGKILQHLRQRELQRAMAKAIKAHHPLPHPFIDDAGRLQSKNPSQLVLGEQVCGV